MASKDFKNAIRGGNKDANIISQLIRGTTQKDEDYTLVWLPHDKVYSVAQVRKKFKNIEGLAATMKGRRQNEAITVYPADEDGRHQIKTGERRWRAAVLNNEPVLTKIANRLKKSTDAKTIIEQIVENDQREPLTPMEMAEQLGELRDLFEMKPGQIAAEMGRTPAYISKHLKLLEMPEQVQSLMEEGVVTYIETLNILTTVFTVSTEAGQKLVDDARQKGELSRTEAQDFLKSIKGKNVDGNNNQQLDDNSNQQTGGNNYQQLDDNSDQQTGGNNNQQQDDNSDQQTGSNNSQQLDDNRGQQTGGNNSQQLDDNSGQQTGSNNSQQLDDNSGQQTGSNNSQQLDDYSDHHQDGNSNHQPGSQSGKDLSKPAKGSVTFYVKIDDAVFELVDKPSITENGEVFIFCREREGMPEMQVPITDCSLHHASLTK